MWLHVAQALQYLEGLGYPMSERTGESRESNPWTDNVDDMDKPNPKPEPVTTTTTNAMITPSLADNISNNDNEQSQDIG